MSRPVSSSDLHLGHRNICKYRTRFNSEEEHSEYVLQMHIATIKKNDTWFCLGDCAATKEWLLRLKEIKCRRKILILGNHDLEWGLTMQDLLEVFDEVHALMPRKFDGVRYWLSHCPIHPDELRGKALNIHGHTHQHVLDDPRYVNVCVEHTGYGVVPIGDITEQIKKGIEK